jgi:2-oxoglutarate dehydrogenase E1 component
MNGFEGLALANKDYVADQYRRWKDDPRSVDESWRLFFAGFELATDGRNGAGLLAEEAAAARAPSAAGAAPAGPELGAFDLVHSYRELGHLVAYLNPLAPQPGGHPLLEPSEFGFGDGDLERPVDSGSFQGVGSVPLRELIARLRATYCGTIGVEYLHIPDREQRIWLQERMEPTLNKPVLTDEDRVRILDQLVVAEGFEQFLQVRYPTAKRFSLEGSESLIPILHELIDGGGDLGVEEMVFGMPHRGRLNVLVNVLRKPYEMVLSEFEGSLLAREATGDGDVKYHLGYSRDHTTRSRRKVHLSLSSNPSHLEAVNPVIEGMVRAKQSHLLDESHSRVVSVLMHGDAAFTGQGVVAETLWLSELEEYRTGGTIHIIVNNQIGFTTCPPDYRFTPYPSDVAKIIQAPVFHVNGDDPEAGVQAARLAIAFRQQFKKDVFIDLVCYRKHGHNELDDPTFTQPTMYREIASHPSPLAQYRDKLVTAGTLTAEAADRRATEFRELLVDAQSYARDFMPRQQIFVFGGLWKGFAWAGDDWSADTAVPEAVLREIGGVFTRIPEGFTPHPKVLRMMEAREAMVVQGSDIDWGCGEALAFGSLVLEGTEVRVSGQDTRRGTFSHRHAVLHDIENDAQWVPLAHIRAGQAPFVIIDSMLSENACLGFEFGFSMADPTKLVVWEAQFGDFANGAQVVIDQFIAAGEVKWGRICGLTLLLPHGYEGQGPEHSSARPERYLQLCAEHNMQVCVPTTPAQIFHLLRRQMVRPFRKPLIVMSPKSLLRHKAAVSSLEDLASGRFQTVIGDAEKLAAGDVRRVIVCSGKVYYDLVDYRRENKIADMAVIRLEQQYPFPHADFKREIAQYPAATEVVWCQEEPQNQGAWYRLRAYLRGDIGEKQVLAYAGRPISASPAVGSAAKHLAQQQQLVADAFAAKLASGEMVTAH